MVGTVDSGLNSVVLANENEMVLLPINEPTYGTKRKSQIQTYLEQNNVRNDVVVLYCTCCACDLFFPLLPLLIAISISQKSILPMKFLLLLSLILLNRFFKLFVQHHDTPNYN